jgi:hypothetical protein
MQSSPSQNIQSLMPASDQVCLDLRRLGERHHQGATSEREAGYRRSQ